MRKAARKYVRELEDKIIAHELGGTVSIVGHTSDMAAAAYMLADIVLAPSTRPEALDGWRLKPLPWRGPSSSRIMAASAKR